MCSGSWDTDPNIVCADRDANGDGHLGMRRTMRHVRVAQRMLACRTARGIRVPAYMCAIDASPEHARARSPKLSTPSSVAVLLATGSTSTSSAVVGPFASSKWCKKPGGPCHCSSGKGGSFASALSCGATSLVRQWIPTMRCRNTCVIHKAICTVTTRDHYFTTLR